MATYKCERLSVITPYTNSLSQDLAHVKKLEAKSQGNKTWGRLEDIILRIEAMLEQCGPITASSTLENDCVRIKQLVKKRK
jgi:hypothetical protein